MEEGKPAVKEEKKEVRTVYVSNNAKNPWMLYTAVLAVIVVILAFFLYSGKGGVTGDVIDKDKAAEKLVTYLNSRTGGGVELISSEEDGSLYMVMVSYQGDEIPVYVTKDGEYFVQGIVPITSSNTPTTATTIPKTEKPKVELFVMSFCPYGNMAEATMLPVYELLKDKVDWNVHYIVSVSGDTISSLHGQPETDQNIREVCVLNEYGQDKFWKFMTYVNENCGSDGGCWESAAKESAISVSKIKSCFDSEGLDLMKQEAQISSDAEASGSPTLLINGVKSSEVYKYGNSEAYKQAICSAFENPPEECDEGISSSTATNSTGGSC